VSTGGLCYQRLVPVVFSMKHALIYQCHRFRSLCPYSTRILITGYCPGLSYRRSECTSLENRGNYCDGLRETYCIMFFKPNVATLPTVESNFAGKEQCKVASVIICDVVCVCVGGDHGGKPFSSFTLINSYYEAVTEHHATKAKWGIGGTAPLILSSRH
jgi:hypothetical protein